MAHDFLGVCLAFGVVAVVVLLFEGREVFCLGTLIFADGEAAALRAQQFAVHLFDGRKDVVVLGHYL